MIVYLATAAHRYTPLVFLETVGHALNARVSILDYERAFAIEGAPPATYIFSDLERLDGAATAQAVRLWQRLAAGGRARLLNDPARVLRRFELLRALHNSGVNPFDVYRLTEARRPARYPVFLRGESDHDGAIGGLLDSPAALDTAVAELIARGGARAGTLAVEFVDVADGAGFYHKYSAFRVGDRIVASDLDFSRNWVAKPAAPESENPAHYTAQDDYVRANPHATALMAIFKRAEIDYGRIDYAMKDGRICVFEINTNPTILEARWHDPAWVSARRYFAAELADALRALDDVPGRGPRLGLRASLKAARAPGTYRTRLMIRDVLQGLGLIALERPLVRAIRRLRGSPAKH
jgi:hypothetical protein